MKMSRLKSPSLTIELLGGKKKKKLHYNFEMDSLDLKNKYNGPFFSFHLKLMYGG